jgi:phosphoesterase RecJ-like protein
MNSISEIAEQLHLTDNFIIIGHTIPDGDCIGSMLGLYWGLKTNRKVVRMFLSGDVPAIYHYLAGWEEIRPAEELVPGEENIIFVDCADRERVGDKILQRIKNRPVFINIDHHLQDKPYASYNYVNPVAAATGEIIFDLLPAMGVDTTPQIADCLYAAILMDTGRFMNNNTTPTTMRVAAELIDLGADIDQARVSLFESKSHLEVLLLGQALKHIDFSEDGRIAWMSLPYDEVKSIDALDFHPEGIINYTRMIAGVEVGLLFREIEPGVVKIGFRSKGQTNVAAIAQAFNGGGHRQAAGARQEGNLEEVRERVISMVKDVIA